MQQLSFEGMPIRLYPCTPSRLNQWIDCPRRYRMTYLDRPSPPKGPPWAHNSVGASVHNALADWWRLPEHERTPEAAGRLLHRDWLRDGFRDQEQATAWRDWAREMVVRYAQQLDPTDEPLGVERTVAMRTDTIAVSGRVDRIDARPDVGVDGPEAEASGNGTSSGDGTGSSDSELVVVDYKTGRRVLTTDDARSSLALALYALAAARVLRRPCYRVELHHLPTGDVVSWEHTDATLARHLRRAEEIAAECSAADAAYREGLSAEDTDEVFPPRPSPGCAWCDFVRQCPEGRAQHAPRDPWDGLARDDRA